MADTKISALSSGAPAQGTDETVIARGGANYKLTVSDIVGYLGSPVSVANGGTGQSTYTNGQLLIGNSSGNTLTKATLTAGSGVSITNGSGSITIAATGSGGTVTSVGGTGTVNGITLTGTVTSSGNLTLGGTLTGVDLTSQVTGTLPIANGGTGSTSTTYCNLASNVTGTLPIANGGTGATTLAGANIAVFNASNTFTAAQTFRAASAVRSEAAATQDAVVLAGRAGGTNSYAITLTPATLSSSTTLTLPNVTSTVAVLGTAQTFTAAQTFASGDIKMNGSSSGTITFAVPAAAGTNTVTFPAETMTVGFRNIPQSGSDKTTSYSLAVGDVGKFVGVGASGSITIPDATFAAGDVVSIFNNTSGAITITCSITTAYIAGTDADKATVSLATRGVATVLFLSGTVCVISGNVS